MSTQYRCQLWPRVTVIRVVGELVVARISTLDALDKTRTRCNYGKKRRRASESDLAGRGRVREGTRDRLLG